MKTGLDKDEKNLSFYWESQKYLCQDKQCMIWLKRIAAEYFMKDIAFIWLSLMDTVVIQLNIFILIWYNLL